MSSATVFAGNPGFTAIIIGEVTSSATGEKSRSGE
jgi:hypothetical protein